MDEVQNLSDKIKKQLEQLDSETLEVIYRYHAKAVEYVKIGFSKVSVEELNNRSIEDIAKEMQMVAKIELNQRLETKQV